MTLDPSKGHEDSPTVLKSMDSPLVATPPTLSPDASDLKVDHSFGDEALIDSIIRDIPMHDSKSIPASTDINDEENMAAAATMCISSLYWAPEVIYAETHVSIPTIPYEATSAYYPPIFTAADFCSMEEWTAPTIPTIRGSTAVHHVNEAFSPAIVNGVSAAPLFTRNGPQFDTSSEETLAAIKKAISATVTAEVNEVPTRPLVDSGADPNAVSSKFVTLHPDAFEVVPLQFPIQVAAVNNQHLTIKGRVRIRVRLDGESLHGRKRHRTYAAWAYVIDGLRHDVILGLDFLKMANVVVDFASGTLKHGAAQLITHLDYSQTRQGLLDDPSTQVGVVSIEERILEPLSGCHFKVKLDNLSPTFKGTISNMYLLRAMRIARRPSLVLLIGRRRTKLISLV